METEQPRTSPWVNIIAGSSLFLATLYGYSMLSQSMNDNCRAKAARASIIVSVHETKWTLAGCQYFYSHKYIDSKPKWDDGDMFEAIYVDNEPK